jgi:hypothetical protein
LENSKIKINKNKPLCEIIADTQIVLQANSRSRKAVEISQLYTQKKECSIAIKKVVEG